jgi:glycerophosphoryl diester phosphodiesterase
MPNPFPRPLVLGHRGAPREATENTLRSLDLALQHGADGVEFDVQRARDGVPVVIHDDTLNRTMRARGSVSQLAWTAIQQVTRAQVPSLEQVCAWAAASGAWLNIEIKAHDVEEAVLQTLDEHGLKDQTFLSSFDHHTVGRLGEIDASFRRFFLTERWDPAAHERLLSCGASGVCLGVSGSTPSALDALSALDLPVVVWTVNEPARVRELLLAGAAAIITDDPAMAVAIRDELGRS